MSREDDNDGARAFLEREERQREKERLEKEKGEGKLQREEWMLVPPKEMDLMSSKSTQLSIVPVCIADYPNPRPLQAWIQPNSSLVHSNQDRKHKYQLEREG